MNVERVKRWTNRNDVANTHVTPGPTPLLRLPFNPFKSTFAPNIPARVNPAPLLPTSTAISAPPVSTPATFSLAGDNPPFSPPVDTTGEFG